ncbi:MAG TPA: adenosylmethionine--8-amino-7-oxononanoate transaminase [Gemmata sp.]|jgi:adenosylmethionine-8-amino-7-oxononanoate transaminase/dethiobiotin synthase|nr:adenosylmethionine--8-amino-7-oxononanoate transaminase [Gemmata sp.]
MKGFVIVGTDTDAGKTTFSLLFLTAFADQFDYWKPVETGDSDSERVRKLVPRVTVHEPLARFREPVAPCLAARLEGKVMPGVAEIIAAIPNTSKPLLIETFGGPYSPLTDDVLQIELIRAFQLPVLLVTSSAVGAVGRTLATVRAMAEFGVEVAAIALLGRTDAFAVAQIEKHTGKKILSLSTPEGQWNEEALHCVAVEEFQGHWDKWLTSSVVKPERCEPRELINRDRSVIWHPYTSLSEPTDPLPVIGAEREFLHLADGRTLIDAISSWWTILHGHRHPPLMNALATAAENLDHVLFAGATHPPAVELAELLLASTPWKGGRVFYSDNGSTAVEVALKMAYQFWCHRGQPGRTLFVSFENGYHGDTFGAMAVGRDPLFFGAFEPLLFKTLQIPIATEHLDATLREYSDQVAAVILEPLVQGASGMRMHSIDELLAIFEVTKKHNVLFIADEVMTGCRTGKRWAHQHAGIAPDLICAAKTLAGGILPLAATLASPEIVCAFQTSDRSKTFFHGHSFTANPLACAVAVENWRLLTNDHRQKDASRIESFWQKHLLPLRERPVVKDVRICGTIAAVELNVPGGYLADIAPRIRQHAISRGVLLRPLGSVVYSIPPLCTSEESLHRIAETMRESVEFVTS